MIKYKEPSVLGPTEVFKWWLHNLKKEKPYLKASNYCYLRKKNVLGKKRDVEIISINREELTYLRGKILAIDTEIIELEQGDLHKWYFTEITYKILALKKEIIQIE